MPPGPYRKRTSRKKIHRDHPPEHSGEHSSQPGAKGYTDGPSAEPVPQECLQVRIAKELQERSFKETIRQNIQENIQANQAPRDTLIEVQQKLVPEECLLTTRKKENKSKVALRPFGSQVQVHVAQPIATQLRGPPQLGGRKHLFFSVHWHQPKAPAETKTKQKHNTKST